MSESTPTTPNDEAPTYRKRGKSRKPLIVTIAIVAVVAIVAAVLIWLNRDTSATPGTSDDVPAETGGEITIGLTLEPSNLDIRTTGGVALDQVLIDNIYQGLIGIAPGSVADFVPVLAEQLPEVSDDGLSYTFTLRQGVSFASGNPLTSADVIDSLNTGLPTVGIENATVTSPDEQTVVIELTEPNSQLLWQLANRPGLIFETAYAGDLANTANGTGPYLLEEWKQGDSITFVANENYWGDAPTLDTVVWRYITDGNAAVNAALEGDVDVLAPVQSRDLVSQLEGNGFSLVNPEGTDVFTLGYNSAKAPLDDVRVRTAISKAIDGEAIVEAFRGDGNVLGGPITKLEPAYEDLTAVNAYDPEGARELLAEAGVEDLELTVTVPNFYTTDAIDVVVTQLAEVGITLKIDSVEFATWLSDVYTAPEDGSPRNFELSYIDHAEANDFANYVNPDYYFGLVNEDAQSLYAESITATDSAAAADLVKQAARLVAEDAPAKWLINWTPVSAVSEQVHGFPEANTNSRIPLAGITSEQ